MLGRDFKTKENIQDEGEEHGVRGGKGNWEWNGRLETKGGVGVRTHENYAEYWEAEK